MARNIKDSLDKEIALRISQKIEFEEKERSREAEFQQQLQEKNEEMNELKG